MPCSRMADVAGPEPTPADGETRTARGMARHAGASAEPTPVWNVPPGAPAPAGAAEGAEAAGRGARTRAAVQAAIQSSDRARTGVHPHGFISAGPQRGAPSIVRLGDPSGPPTGISKHTGPEPERAPSRHAHSRRSPNMSADGIRGAESRSQVCAPRTALRAIRSQ